MLYYTFLYSAMLYYNTILDYTILNNAILNTARLCWVHASIFVPESSATLRRVSQRSRQY